MIRPMKLVYLSEEYDNINHMMNQMVVDGCTPNQIKVYLSRMYDFTESVIESIISAYHIEDRFNERIDRGHITKIKDTNELGFKYETDRLFFIDLFDLKEDETYKIAQYFDFRSSTQKRKEFNSKKNELLQYLIQDNGLRCILNISSKCTIESGITIDHIIPLSTNILSKELRHMKSEEKGKKVQSESYGSNHYDNLIIACKNCNSHKKHRLLAKDKMNEVLAKKQTKK